MRVLESACLVAILAAAVAPAGSVRCRETYQAHTFFGYACDRTCAHHKAGFAWAERHGITTPAACAAIEPPMRAGCSAFAAEGLGPVDAGYEWALENEIADPALCTGAGEAFRQGCRRYVDESPHWPSHRCAKAWPRHAEAFPAQTVGR